MVNQIGLDTIILQMDLMENEIIYMKGKMRTKAKKAYLKLLKSSAKKLGLDQPIYLLRCE